MDLRRISTIDAGQQAALAELLQATEATDRHPALSEPQRAALTHADLGGIGTELVLASLAAEVVGCAVISTHSDDSHEMQLVIASAYRADVGLRDQLLHAALRSLSGLVRLWIFQAASDSDAAVAPFGFVPERDLMQMRVPLPLADTLTSSLVPLMTRPFVPGVDDQEWLALNNLAFAGHPEQGDWTLSTLHERMALDWFDPAGFRVARDDAGRMVGSCWTKVHHRSEPILGEIYVISVDPEFHGHHLGKRLAVAGLDWLAEQGVGHGMLYVEADNEAAVHLYRWLGFTEDHLDRCYILQKP
jgi:mycothiol synthase